MKNGTYTRDELGDVLRDARTQQQLTQTQAADLANDVAGTALRKQEVSTVEHGRGGGTMDYARKALCQALLGKGVKTRTETRTWFVVE